MFKALRQRFGRVAPVPTPKPVPESIRSLAAEVWPYLGIRGADHVLAGDTLVKQLAVTGSLVLTALRRMLAILTSQRRATTPGIPVDRVIDFLVGFGGLAIHQDRHGADLRHALRWELRRADLTLKALEHIVVTVEFDEGGKNVIQN